MRRYERGRARSLPLLIVSVGVVAAIGLTAGSPPSPAATAAAPVRPADPPATPASQPVPLRVTAQPPIGATDVSPGAPATITVTGGSIAELTLTNPSGKPVAGRLAPDATSFTITEPLGFAKTYTWSGRATGTDGTATTISGSFTTVKPKRQVRARINTGDSQTYGVAMPVAVTFDAPVTDKAAVQQALNVQTSTPTEGAWAWLDDRTVHWRPKDYWRPGTHVTVTAKLYGVPYGHGAYGQADLTSPFTIGRAQIVQANTQTHRMIVIQDGVRIGDYPASYGLDSDPGRVTRSGTHIVMAKFPRSLFSNPKYDYKDVPVQWAVRISANGEFIHSAPWSVGDQGKRNVSHGCANLAPSDAKTYYDGALIGDPVEITGSTQQLSQVDGDYYDWTLTWEEWTSRSALSR